MYIGARSRDNYCHRKAMSISYYDCMFSCFLSPAMKCACAVFYCRLQHVCFYHIFPYYFTNGTILGKMLFNIKCVFLFSLQLLSEIFFILRTLIRRFSASNQVVQTGITKIKHVFYMKRYEILQDLTRATIRNATLRLHFRSQFIPAVLRFSVQKLHS
jgi:hypothetical protein